MATGPQAPSGNASSLLLLAAVSLTLCFSRPLAAHNGGVALGVPLTQVAIDGRLDDWPETHPAQPISWTAYGRHPTGPADMQGWFRAGRELDGSVVVAVEVLDESIIVDGSAQSNWDTQDGCELFISWGHDEDVTQYSIFGDRQFIGDATVAVRRGQPTIYEWRIPAPKVATARTVGFDVVICDRDDDGSFTWQAFGRGEQKVSVPGRLGDLLFPAAEIGQLEGSVQALRPAALESRALRRPVRSRASVLQGLDHLSQGHGTLRRRRVTDVAHDLHR